ncbi:hypothetical protein MNBD_GAMMA26-1980 [hydrothermal vent metagenome]|uniref:Cytochrome c7-like domain-containing protein n=1 Tax=hydrothermal vent metagenome TaxID=652676 RepID=A0A3B1AYR2_9ZZZZ
MIKALLTVILFITPFTAIYAIDVIDIILKSKAPGATEAGLGKVTYPHKLHETWYECEDCHPKIFVAKIGGNDMDMERNMTGKDCGYSGCHNSAYAFPLYLCDKCHEVLEQPAEK